MRTMCSLTAEEIRQIVNDIWEPNEITKIKRNTRTESISFTITTTWGEGDTEVDVDDRICIRNPFDYGEDAIDPDDPGFPVNEADYERLRQFCYAKGIFPTYLDKNNPYKREW